MILIATSSLRATWLPEGLNKSFVCTHILKISYEQLFCVIYILVFSLLLRLICIFVFVSVLEGQSDV